MSMHYIVCWNMPGCLPEMEPEEHETFDSAKRSLIDELKACEDQAPSEDVAEDFCHAAEDVNVWTDGDPCHSVSIGGYIYSICRMTKP